MIQIDPVCGTDPVCESYIYNELTITLIFLNHLKALQCNHCMKMISLK